MRHGVRTVTKLCGLLAVLLFVPACLSIGGKTYSGNSPDTDVRLSSLESRVGHLEQAINVDHASSPTPATMPFSMPPGMQMPAP